jgi:hypothetical protein
MAIWGKVVGTQHNLTLSYVGARTRWPRGLRNGVIMPIKMTLNYMGVRVIAKKPWKLLGVKAWLGYPFWNTKDSLLKHSNLFFSSFFLWFVLGFPLFFMSNNLIFSKILYKHLEYLLFSLMKARIIKFIQCGPCFINGPKLFEISLFEFFYITIGHLVFITLIHFMYIST